MSGALQVCDLTVARGERRVVRGVSLTVPRGAVTALIGPNGGGKSTTVQAVAGVLPAAGGSIGIDGVGELTGRPAHAIRAAGVAVVPEGHRVVGDLTVSENLAVAAYRQPAREARASAKSALLVFPELGDKSSRLASTLSGGEQQMLALAQALISRPRFLIVDELSFGLAPAVVSRLIPVVRKVAVDGVGVLLIEQFTNVALEVSSTAYLMEGGRIRHHGSSEGLRERPELLHSAYLRAGREAQPLALSGQPEG